MQEQTKLRHEPFDVDFNHAVAHIASVIVGHYIVSDNAPSTYRQLKAHLGAGKTMVVAHEGSEATIFGDAAANWAFRAWHDWTHWKGGFDFSLYGESATCNMQIDCLLAFYGVNAATMKWRDYLIAEIIGQRRYYERYKAYLSDQRAFAVAYIKDPVFALSRMW